MNEWIGEGWVPRGGMGDAACVRLVGRVPRGGMFKRLWEE